MSTLPDAFTTNSSPEGIEALPAPSGSDSWQRDLSQAIRSSLELLARLNLTPNTESIGRTLSEIESDFPVLVPESYLRRIRPNDPLDPLLLQVLASSQELTQVSGFQADAVHDLAARRAPGVLQKYQGRALLMAAGACAIHCRYCFRREYPYGAEPKRVDDWKPALELLREDSSIHEVILSGGDPLMLNDDRLGWLCEQLDQIPHLDRLRIHSRMPIVLPSRVTPALISLLQSLRMQPMMIVHANHANEIVDDCLAALRLLVRSGIPTMNQAVLLRGINDNTAALSSLSTVLVNNGVMPYYLHQLDRVSGTSHFEVSEETGRQLIRELGARLPGYAVPRYVREIPGAPGKTLLDSESRP